MRSSALLALVAASLAGIVTGSPIAIDPLQIADPPVLNARVDKADPPVLNARVIADPPVLNA